MKLTTDLGALKTMINNASYFVSEVHLGLVEGRLNVSEISLDNTTFYSATLQDVTAEDEGEFEVFVSAQHLAKVLKTLGKANRVVLAYDKGVFEISTPNNSKKFRMPVSQSRSVSTNCILEASLLAALAPSTALPKTSPAKASLVVVSGSGFLL